MPTTTKKPTTAAKPAAKPAPKPAAKPAPKPAAKPAPAKAEAKKEVSHDYHVSLDKTKKKWKVFNAGSDKVIKLFDTQAEALTYAKGLAKNNDGHVMLHGVDGKLRKF